MKSVLKKLETLREQIVAQCEKRDKYFTTRSDQWQESAKGRAYEYKTAELANSVIGIDDAITEIKSFLE